MAVGDRILASRMLFIPRIKSMPCVSLTSVGKSIPLATLMFFMFRTELATTLSEFKLMVRMSFKLLGVTIVDLTTLAIMFGSAPRLSQFTLALTTPLKRVIFFSVSHKILLLGENKA